MRYLLLTLTVFLLLAVQAPLLRVLGIEHYSIDAALVAILYLAATASGSAGLIAASAIGFMADAFAAGGILGMNMEILVIMYLLGLGLAARFHLMSAVPLVMVALLCSVTQMLLFFLFSVLFDRGFGSSTRMLLEAIPHALLTSMFAPILFPLFSLIDRGTRGRRPGSDGVLLR